MTTYTANNPVPMPALPTISGVKQEFLVASTNDGASTYAPDGLAPAPIFGLGGQQLQGNEIVAGGIATLVSFVEPLLNDGELCWILVGCTAGAVQVAPAIASKQAAQLSQVTAVAGATRNLAAIQPAAASTLTFTADELLLKTGLGGLPIILSSFNETLNLAGPVGIGGMDAGSPPANGYVGIYAAWNPTAGTRGIFATNATSSIVGETYGGQNLPAGFTYTELISVWPTDSAGKLKVGFQKERSIGITPVTVMNSGVLTSTFKAFSIASAVPMNAKSADLNGNVGVGGQTGISADFIVASTSTGAGVGMVAGFNPPDTFSGNGSSKSMITVPQTLFYVLTTTATTGVINAELGLNSYSF